MADSVSRALREGALEGEHAPALMIKDSTVSPLGSGVFNHFLTLLSSHILAGKSQSEGLVLVALSRSPSFYGDLLRSKGFDLASSRKWFRVLDCYTDPLGWKDRLRENGRITDAYADAAVASSLFKDVKNWDALFSSILDTRKGITGEEKSRLSIAIDSVSELLRHLSVSSVSRLISNLRSDGRVSCVFCLLHSDLHDAKTTAACEYMSSILVTVEPVAGSTTLSRDYFSDQHLLENNYKRGKFHARLKRRNGRVRVLYEELTIEESEIKFTSATPEDYLVSQSLVPKVQFNLQLSEKERIDRDRVVLPFEHQGNGKPVQIYDGRRSLLEGKFDAKAVSGEKGQMGEEHGKGEIIYFRDSDDEMRDSDEDPDDDLDI